MFVEFKVLIFKDKICRIHHADSYIKYLKSIN